MVFRNIFLYVGLTLFLGFAFTGEPSRAQIPHKFKVYVSVDCEDERIKSLIQSQIKRELRSLGDVLVVGFDDARYILSMVTMELEHEATHRKTGAIAIGSMFLRKTPSEDFYFPDLWVSAGDTKEVERLSKSLVAQIDTQHFERIRELFH